MAQGFRIAIKRMSGKARLVVAAHKAECRAGLLLGVLGFLLLLAPRPVALALTPTPTPSGVKITTPRPGQAVQGQVRVLGFTDVAGFRKSALFFGYAEDPTHTWFLIEEKRIPAHGGLVGRWDTTLITDGNYVLRLTVEDRLGHRYETTVPVRVRNYTPVETPTPGGATPEVNGVQQPTLMPASTLTPTPLWPTPPPVPPNPIVLSPDTLTRAAAYGVAAVIMLLVLFGSLRRWR